MEKKHRLHKKREKRLIKLAYRKGYIDIDIYELHWQTSECRFRCVIYYDYDYWSECDEYPVIHCLVSSMIFAESIEHQSLGLYYGAAQKYTRSYLSMIRYLKNQPTVKNDCIINRVLNYSNN
jgi:hypothetical protein